jgi:hypothetical protein
LATKQPDSERTAPDQANQGVALANPARGSFDHQRLFGALANRITLNPDGFSSEWQ